MSYPVGSRVYIRSEEWLVKDCKSTNTGHYAVRVVGISETVRDYEATFLSSVDEIDLVKPEDTEFITDNSDSYRRSKLYLHALMTRTPIIGNEITTRGQAAMEDSDYQYIPAQLAMSQNRPRILIADGVGLGKTIEAGVLLSELIRRGRGRRILVVATRSMLEQLQKELWTRFSIPLMRLDSVGIARIRRDIPQNKNPFHYYDKVIVSVDTLKDDDQYRRYLENCYWDLVFIDECHNVANASTERNRLATLLANRCHSLILTSATPHNGKPESFATLLRMLDPTAVADPETLTKEDIEHLVVRRFKTDVLPQTPGFQKVNDKSIDCRATSAEEEVLSLLKDTLVHSVDSGKSHRDALFSVTLLKAFLSSPVAFLATLGQRIRRLEQLLKQPNTKTEVRTRDLKQLRLLESQASRISMRDSSKFQELCRLLREWNWSGKKNSGRVIVFSERIDTLESLKTELEEEFGLKEGAIALFTAKMPDTEQAKIVREFNEEASSIRLLLASDVASEGVNLHHRCHHMIHFDIPWSFIRLQQRNGRIDRFGQKNTPEIRYLILQSQAEEADTRIVGKLVEKAQSIENNLGDPSSILHLFDAEQEEKHVQAELAAGKSIDQIFDSNDDEDWDDFFDPIPRTQAHATVRTLSVPAIYHNWLDVAADLQVEMVRQRERYRMETGTIDPMRKNEQLRIDRDKKRVILSGIQDLKVRMRSLPPEARSDEEVQMTTDVQRVMKSIQVATAEGQWSQEHLLWDIHPVAEWILDRALGLYRSKQAPSIRLNFLPPGEVHYIMQAIVLTASGHPALSEWMIVRFDGQSFTVRLWQGMHDPLLSSTWINPGTADEKEHDLQLPQAIEQARTYIDGRMGDVLGSLKERVDRERARVEEWFERSYKAEQMRFFDDETKHARQSRRLEEKRHRLAATYKATIEGLESLLKVQEPLLRVCARFTNGQEV